MRIIGLIFLSLILGTVAHCQEDENVDKYMTALVASDTILNGNTFEFKITIRNLKGEFTPPLFQDFDIVGGPNMSTSMQYVNGNMFREMTYTFFLQAKKIGPNYIEEAYLEIEDGNMETSAIPIYITDNPEGIEQVYRINSDSKPAFFFPFGEQGKKKTRKTKRKLRKI